MLFSSPLQLLVLCAVAVGSWLLGYATNPSGINRDKAMRKLDRAFASFRTQAQSRINTLTRHAAALDATHQTIAARLSDAEARIARFQLDASERADGPPLPEPFNPREDDEPLFDGIASPTPPDAEPIPIDTPDAAGARDTLTRIDGIDAALDLRLSELGITRFEDIEKLSDQDEMALELRLALPGGYITGRQWRQQATALRTADLETSAKGFSTPPV